MKRILSFLAALILVLPVITTANAYSQDNLALTRGRNLQREQRREARAYRRVMEASGFEILGAHILEDMILRHMERRDSLGPDGVEFLGKGISKYFSKSRLLALKEVVTEYAQRSVAAVKDSCVCSLADNAMQEEDLENLYVTYEDLLTKKIRGILHESYSIRRTMPDGSHDVRMMCLLDECVARKARLEAMEEAIEESGVGSEHADYLKAQAVRPILNRYEDLIQL